ncbi:MAG: DUF2218 domain-containing protein [Paracoccaceae bacterium]
MTQSTTTFETAHASKYLQQLCKHFGHKVPTEFTPTEGRVSLPFGTCRLAADETKLTLEADADPARLSKLEGFLADHLARFAFREPHKLVWQRAG